MCIALRKELLIIGISKLLNTLLFKKCLKLCKNKYQTEYSGNATYKNIKQISKTGVNRISVGTITHSAKSFDSSLLIL